MQVKIKKKDKDGIVRLEAKGSIMEVLINEDIFNPKKESISLCFRGNNSSGIIDLAPDEFEDLYQNVKDRLHLIKDVKKLKG